MAGDQLPEWLERGHARQSTNATGSPQRPQRRVPPLPPQQDSVTAAVSPAAAATLQVGIFS